jgi:hypothetical protein
VLIRQFRPDDRPDIFRICFGTAFYGQPMGPYMGDTELVCEFLLGYYMRFEAESFFVADDGGRVVGYLSGCLNTRKQPLRFVWSSGPRLLARALMNGHLFNPAFIRFIVRFARGGSRWKLKRDRVLSQYPAHCHMNIAPGSRKAGAGRLLWEAFKRQLIEKSVPGVHAASATDGGKNFFMKAGFHVLDKYPSPDLGFGMPPDVWVMGLQLNK